MKAVIYIVLISFAFLSCKNSNKDELRSDICGDTLQLALETNYVTFYPPAILDDVEKQIVSQIHLGLFKYNPQNLTIETAICKSWDVDNTGRVYIFYLDSTAFFHDDPCFQNGNGRHVNAYDVEFSFYLLATQSDLNKNFTNTISRIQGAKEYYKNSKNNSDLSKLKIDGIKVLSDYIIKITLETPSALFIYNLAHPAASILPREAIEQYGQNLMVGAGPFYSYNQLDANKIVFKRNPNYFMFENNIRLPYLDELIFRKVSNFDTIVTWYKSHKLDALLFVENEKIPSIINKIQQSVPYKLVKSSHSSDLNNSYYNIIDEEVQDLNTNDLRILDLSRVYKQEVKKVDN